MNIDKESLEQLTNALTEATRNSFVSEKPESKILVVVYCHTCEEFHMYSLTPQEILDSSNIIATSIGMLFDGMEATFVKACKDTGAKIASSNKEIVATALIGAGGTIEIKDEGIVDKLNELSEEEAMKVADMVIKGEIDESKFTTRNTIFVNAYAPPNSYYSISYDVELVGNNDVLLVNRDEENDKGEGNMYSMLEAFANGSRMIRNIQAAIEPCDETKGKMGEENKEKFRLLIDRITSSSSLEELV